MIVPDFMTVTAALCAGGIVGSFVGAAVIRLPQGRSIVVGRSRCDGCDRVLRPVELVPVLSYVALGGRCRRCATTIAIDQPLAEIGGVVVAGLAIVAMADPLGAVLLAVFGWCLLALALLDWRHLWLPNTIVLPMIPSGLLAGLVMAPAMAERLVAALLGYAALEALRRGYRRFRHRDGMGAGDPKLLAAIGAWLGIADLPWVILLGALIVFAGVAARRWIGSPVSIEDRLPLGTGLAIAAILVMPFATSS